LGERYGLLPSEVLKRATTLDIMVLDVSLSFEKYRSDRAQGITPEYRQEDLKNILSTFKEQHNGK